MPKPPQFEELEIQFDAAKSWMNERTRGLPFSRMADFVWETAIVWPDYRPTAFGELRYLAVGLINDRLHVVSFAFRRPAIVVFALRELGSERTTYRRVEAMWMADCLPPLFESILARGGSARSVLGRIFVSRAPGRRRRAVDPEMLVRARFDRTVGAVRRLRPSFPA
jgi:uncharacterized DUF497 family protein